MERDELIIWVYLWVCEQMQEIKARCPQGRVRRGGFDPALSDEEALTLELCGEMFRLRDVSPARRRGDKAIVCHFQTYYPTWFPHLRHRSAFARQVASLWRLKLQLQERLLLQSHAHAHAHAHDQRIQPVDTLPLPVCAKARAHRDRVFKGLVFKGLARKGFCAAKVLFFYGFKLGLRVTPQGLITRYELLEANTHDCRHLSALVEGHPGRRAPGSCARG